MCVCVCERERDTEREREPLFLLSINDKRQNRERERETEREREGGVIRWCRSYEKVSPTKRESPQMLNSTLAVRGLRPRKPGYQ